MGRLGAGAGSLRLRRSTSAALVIAVAVGIAAPARADRPDTGHLVLAGVGMAPVAYVVGVTLHEGSHAVAAAAMGLDVRSIRLYPGFHPRNHKFYFGWVDVRGVRTSAQRVVFLAAPKLTDAALLGGYAALVLSGAVPENRYGRLALAVLATGTWIDFSRDAVAWWPHNDTVRIYDAIGAKSELQRLPWRLLHAGLAALAAYPIAVGYRGVFGEDDAATMTMPVWTGAF